MRALHFEKARAFVEGELNLCKGEKSALVQMLTILEHGSPKPSGPPMEVGAYKIFPVSNDEIRVYVERQGCAGMLFSITRDGRLTRWGGLSPSLGFALDAQGRVHLAEGG